MITVGITGQTGFVGTNLFNKLNDYPDKFKTIPFKDEYFQKSEELKDYVARCDVIFHLAAMMRSKKEGEVYKTNMLLVNQLINALNKAGCNPCLFFSSSIQENNGSEYGRCKQEGRALLQKWAVEHNTSFMGLIFPNIFGPYAKPNYSSFIATFCYKLIHNEEPQIIVDNIVPLIYIKNLLDKLLPLIEMSYNNKIIQTVQIEPDLNVRVTEVLSILLRFKQVYFNEHKEPKFNSLFEKNLFETFLSYKE